jgi:hypothetical protein
MSKNFLARAKSWAAGKKLLGPQAFLKYVLFVYLDELNRVSDDFVFKDGNLLWIYLQTPRATVDLDLSTLEEADDSRVKAALSSVAKADGILFRLETFQQAKQGGKRAASATVLYETDSGATNKFSIDIVYAAPIDTADLDSPVGLSRRIRAASMENIIADKLLAAQRFKSGNTRMKDFDDLWRISQSRYAVDFKKLKRLLNERGITPGLGSDWISEPMRVAWKSHRKQYNDLPAGLEEVFAELNHWLQ